MYIRLTNHHEKQVQIIQETSEQSSPSNLY